MVGFFFTKGPVTDWNTAKVADTKRFGAFFQGMLDEGVYVAPSQFETGFLLTGAWCRGDREPRFKRWRGIDEL